MPTAASPGKLQVSEASGELRKVPGLQLIGCNQPPSPPLLHILLCVPPPLCPSLLYLLSFCISFFFFFLNICSSVLIHGLLSLCSAALSRSVMSDSLRPHGVFYPARLLCPWDSPGRNAGGVAMPSLQGIFPTQASHNAGGFFTS